jgi:hypothetical protein
MKKLILILSFIICHLSLSVAQNVTRTLHRTAISQDAVSTGSMTVRKPDYICISTDNGKEQLIMEGTKFTMTMGSKKHTTDSRKNAQFATFHEVLKAVINNQPIPEGGEVSVTTKNGQKLITITPQGKKKRQLFTSFELTIDSKTSAMRRLRMNERKGNYTEYTFK